MSWYLKDVLFRRINLFGAGVFPRFAKIRLQVYVCFTDAVAKALSLYLCLGSGGRRRAVLSSLLFLGGVSLIALFSLRAAGEDSRSRVVTADQVMGGQTA